MRSANQSTSQSTVQVHGSSSETKCIFLFFCRVHNTTVTIGGVLVNVLSERRYSNQFKYVMSSEEYSTGYQEEAGWGRKGRGHSQRSIHPPLQKGALTTIWCNYF